MIDVSQFRYRKDGYNLKSFLKTAVFTIVLLLLILAISLSTFAATYPSEDYWATEALNAAVKNQILYGREDGSLDPEANLTRAEMAAIIVRAFGANIKTDISAFTDVSASKWYYNDIAKAVHMGVFVGSGNGLMRPDDTITREEAFTVLARALVLSSSDFSSLDRFADKGNISDWAREYLSILSKKGYVNGNQNGEATPKANITRAEFAQFMHNIFKTYFVNAGTYSSSGPDSTLIRHENISLSNVIIDGDLVIGDGANLTTVTLTNVTIKGRLLVRGAATVKLINTTVGENVVVKNINSNVHFDNYRTEAVFNGINILTSATFKTDAVEPTPGGGGGGGGGGGVTPPAANITVTFDSKGGSEVDKQIVKRGQKVTKPTTPTKEGYTFKYWTLNGTEYDFDTPVTENITLIAQWDIATYEITFYVDGVEIGKKTYQHGDRISKYMDVPVKQGYVFYRWLDMETGHTYGHNVAVNKSVTLHAQFTLIGTYIVTFDSDGGSAVASQTLEKGNKATKPANPTKEGHTFKYWALNGVEYNFDTPVTENIDLKAVWEEYKVKFSFVFNDDTNFIKNTPFFKLFTETPVVLPESGKYVKEGYVFLGWSMTEGSTTAQYPAKYQFTPPSDTEDETIFTFYGVWQKEGETTYKVTFVVDGHQTETYIPVNGVISAYITAPTKTGYDFTGWNTSEDGTGTAYSHSDKITSDVVIYAQFEKKEYTVKFDSMGGSYVASQTVKYEEKASEPTNPERDGFKFAGWYTVEECTLGFEYDFDSKVTDNITLYAKWVEETEIFKVNFYAYNAVSPFETIEVNAADIVDDKTLSDIKADVYNSDEDSFAGYVKDATVSDVYAGENYQHQVEYNWWYETQNGWKIFDKTVKVTEDINVYLRVKKIAINVYVGSIPESFPFEVYYENDTRLLDSVKNLMYFQDPKGEVREKNKHLWVINNALDKVSYDDTLKEKLVGFNIIDENDNILIQDIMVKYSQVLGAENVEKFIVDSAKDSFKRGSNAKLNEGIGDFITTDKEGIKKILSETNVTAEAKMHIIEIAEEKYGDDFLDTIEHQWVTRDQFIDAVINNKGNAYVKVIHYLVDHSDVNPDYISEITEYISFDEPLRNGIVDGIIESIYRAELDKLVYEINNKQQFGVSKKTLFIAEGLRDKLNEEYGYDKIIAKVPHTDKIFRIYPEAKLKKIYNGAFDNLQEQIEAAMAKCEADPSAVAKIDCGLTFNINLVDDVYIPLYNTLVTEMNGKIGDKLFYQNNKYLQALVAHYRPEKLFDGDISGETDKLTGYALKDFDDYYNFRLHSTILEDDVISWYKEKFPLDRVNGILTAYEDLVLRYANVFADFMEGYADGTETVENRYVAAVEKAVKSKVPALYNKALSWYKTSPINKDYEESDYEIFRTAVEEAYNGTDILTDELFDYKYLDTLFDKAEKILVESGVSYTFNTINELTDSNDTCDDADIYEVSVKGFKGTFVRSRDIYEIKVKDFIITVKRAL